MLVLSIIWNQVQQAYFFTNVLALGLVVVRNAQANNTGAIISVIKEVYAGADFHYGVRFILDIESDAVD